MHSQHGGTEKKRAECEGEASRRRRRLIWRLGDANGAGAVVVVEEEYVMSLADLFSYAFSGSQLQLMAERK